MIGLLRSIIVTCSSQGLNIYQIAQVSQNVRLDKLIYNIGKLTQCSSCPIKHGGKWNSRLENLKQKQMTVN